MRPRLPPGGAFLAGIRPPARRHCGSRPLARRVPVAPDLYDLVVVQKLAQDPLELVAAGPVHAQKAHQVPRRRRAVSRRAQELDHRLAQFSIRPAAHARPPETGAT
jgi:hypothetical protein